MSYSSEVTFVPVSKVNGQVEAEDILAAVRPATCLVTIMLANNETGVIMVSCCPPGETDGDAGFWPGLPFSSIL